MPEKDEIKLLKLLKESREMILKYPRDELVLDNILLDLHSHLSDILYGEELDEDTEVGV